MKIANVFKSVFGKKVVIEAPSMTDLVEQLKWAEVEVEDTKDALLGLQLRLQNGVGVMEDIIEESQEIIAHHQQILAKASSRKSEFQGQVSQVTNAVNVINNLYN